MNMLKAAVDFDATTLTNIPYPPIPFGTLTSIVTVGNGYQDVRHDVAPLWRLPPRSAYVLVRVYLWTKLRINERKNKYLFDFSRV